MVKRFGVNEPEKPMLIEEVGAAAFKGVVGAIPVVGPALAEMTGVAVRAGVDKKNYDFVMALSEQVEIIQRRLDMPVDEIFGDPEFQSYLTRAVMIAWETHEDEKIRAVARAAVRSGPWEPTGVSEKEYYWSLLRRYSADYLVILRVLHQPDTLWAEWKMSGDEIALDRIFQEIIGFPAHHDEIGQAIMSTLYQDQLTEAGFGLGYSFVRGEGRSVLTTLGGDFVQFYIENSAEDMTRDK